MLAVSSVLHSADIKICWYIATVRIMCRVTFVLMACIHQLILAVFACNQDDALAAFTDATFVIGTDEPAWHTVLVLKSTVQVTCCADIRKASEGASQAAGCIL